MASVYIHIPFCERKCLYCDFYSIEHLSGMEKFLQSLQKEIVLRAEEFSKPEEIETIFFGGGTPSLLSPLQFDQLLSLLHKHYRIQPRAEITCETNPGTVEQSKLKDFRSVGINRISIGIQSFHDDDLTFLSRIHTAAEANEAMVSAYRAGFENVSCDLIFALPNQTPQRWKENLQQAITLKPKHISAYALIVEENTPLSVMVKDKLVQPLPQEDDAALYQLTMDIMLANGYRQYEVSNFALPGYECRHNINYWNHSNYISFGPSAHSFWKETAVKGKRWWNVRSVQSYCADLDAGKFPVVGSEEIDRAKMYTEEIFLGLRSTGINLNALKKVYGNDIEEEKKNLIASLENEHLIRRNGTMLSLTPSGYMICDEIAAKMMA